MSDHATPGTFHPACDNLSAQLAFGERAMYAVIEAMPLIRFERSKNPALYAVMLYASIIQLCGACLSLARTDFTAGIPVLLRSMFEALVDLDNLVTDASYAERMEAANIDQFLKVVDASPTNPLMAGLERKHDLAAIAAELRTERASKPGQMSIFDRCARVGREHQYRSVYSIFCLDAHNNVAALLDRHTSGGETIETLRLDLFGDGNPFSLARRVFNAVGWMLESASLAHGAFRTGFLVTELLHEHDSLRAGALDDNRVP